MKKITMALILLGFGTSQAQMVENDKGIDIRLDYVALKKLGPWDDRNYELTLEDVSLLSEKEEQLNEITPVFYRVMYRKKYPAAQNTPSFRYPRSLYNYFIMRYNGYLVDGKIYQSFAYNRQTKEYEINLKASKTAGDIIRNQVKALTSDKLVFAGAEAAVSIHPTNPNIVIAGLNGKFGGQEMLFSTDGGNSWTSSPDLTGDECCDPTIEWKSDGSYAYNATLGGNNVWFYRSDDNGQTWDSLADLTPGDNRREIVGSGGGFDDKEYMHVDHSSTSAYKDNIYLLWDNGGVINFARSEDDGNTFNVQSFSSEPAGIGTDLVTDSNGVVYNFWPAYNLSEIRMNKSTNGGVSFGSSTIVADTIASYEFPIPSFDTRNVFLYTSAGVDLSGGAYHNRLYLAWTDSTAATDPNNPTSNHARIQVAYSDNGGNSWTVKTPHNTNDANTVDRWHPWLKVDKNGVVHVAFYDTRNSTNRTGVDFYHSYSNDGGQTWSSPQRLTSVTSNAANDPFQFGDYNGLDFGSDAKGIAIFADNRAEGGAAEDMDVYVAPIATSSDLIFKDGFE